jgi:hypothetical protein
MSHESHLSSINLLETDSLAELASHGQIEP